MKDINTILLLDNEIETTLSEFISVNTADDVEPLTSDEIKSLNALQIDKTICIGMTIIKRIK